MKVREDFSYYGPQPDHDGIGTGLVIVLILAVVGGIGALILAGVVIRAVVNWL